MSENTVVNLRNSIIDGRLKPGTKITEKELSESLNVSRNVVREAILMLSAEGLIVKERNRYTKVVEFTKEDIVDIFDLRIAVEESSIRRCLGCPEILDSLEAYSRKIDDTMKNGADYSDLILADIDFHNHIVASSGNKWLFDTWNRIVGPMKVLMYRHMDDAQAMKCSHKSLIQVIRRGDYHKICDTLENHIGDTVQVLLRNFEESRPS